MSPRAAWRLEELGFEQAYDFVPGKVAWAAMGLPYEGEVAGTPNAGSIADRDFPTCRSDDAVAEVRDKLLAMEADGCVVLNHRDVVVGYLPLDATEKEGETAADLMMDGPSTVRSLQDAHDLFHRMERAHAGHVIVTKLTGEFMGVVTTDAAQQAVSGHRH